MRATAGWCGCLRLCGCRVRHQCVCMCVCVRVCVRASAPLRAPSVTFPAGARDTASGVVTLLPTESVRVASGDPELGGYVGGRAVGVEYSTGAGGAWAAVGPDGKVELGQGEYQLRTRSRVGDVCSAESAAVAVCVRGECVVWVCVVCERGVYFFEGDGVVCVGA